MWIAAATWLGAAGPRAGLPVRAIALAALALAFVLAWPASAEGARYAFPAAADTFVNSDAPDENNGGASRFSAQGASDETRYAYLRSRVELPAGERVPT